MYFRNNYLEKVVKKLSIKRTFNISIRFCLHCDKYSNRVRTLHLFGVSILVKYLAHHVIYNDEPQVFNNIMMKSLDAHISLLIWTF